MTIRPWRLKLDRARFHVKSLKNELRSFNRKERANLRLVFKPDSEPTYYLGYPTLVPALPDRIRVIVGDAIHNYRSVFDNLMWALARKNLNGRVPWKRTQFPIAVTEQDWLAGKKSWQQIHPDALAWVKYMQPYLRRYARKRSLARLNRLDNDDKHRAVHAVRLYVTDIQLLPPAGLSFGENYEMFLGRPLKRGRAVVRVRILGPPHKELHLDGSVSCGVGFAKGLEWEGAFDEFDRLAVGAIELLEPFIDRRRTRPGPPPPVER